MWNAEQRFDLYQRYKELWLLIVGFLLTSLVGAWITGFHQSLADARSDRETRAANARTTGMDTLARISEDISRRHYHSLRMIDQVRAEHRDDPPAAETGAAIRASYASAMEHWNLHWNLMRVLIKRGFSPDLERMFYDYEGDKAHEAAGDTAALSITGKFRTLHRAIRAAEKATDAAAREALLAEAESMYHALGFDLYALYDSMAWRIQTGDLGENLAAQAPGAAARDGSVGP